MRSRAAIAVTSSLALPLLLFLLAGRTPVVLLPVLVGGVAVTALSRRPPAWPDARWQRSARGAPAAGVLAATSDGGGHGSAVLALARVEARELVLSPAFAVGAGFSLLLVVFGWMGARAVEGPWDGSWESFYSDLILAMHPLLGWTAVATHFSVTRSRRHGCDELFDVCPMTRARRTAGHLATAALGSAAALGFAGALVAVVVSGDDTLYGPRNAALAPSLLTIAVLGAGAVALGTATGRWVPWGVAPILALVAVVAIGEWANGPARWVTRRYLASTELGNPVDRIFAQPRPWARLVWLGSVVFLVGCVALLRDRGGMRRAVAAGVVVAVCAAAFIVRPMSGARAAAVADLVTDPRQHQRCVDVGALAVCSYRRYDRVAPRVAAAVAPVVAAAPPHALEGVAFLQLPPKRSLLPREVVQRLGDRQPDTAPGLHDLGFETTPAHLVALRLRVAAVAVGAPAEPPGETPAVIAGQARGVLMLWLASRGMPLDEALDLAPDRDLTGGPTSAGMAWPSDCGDDASVIWSRQDFRAARALMRQPDTAVAPVVQAGWRHFTDPATPTDELLDALGLARVGPPDPGIEPAGYSC